MIRIKSYAAEKISAASGKTSSSSGFAKATTSNVEGVRIWGQYHDHTADVEGDMTGVGNIAMNGNIVGAKTINSNNVITTYLTAVDGGINDLHSDTITADTSVTTDDLYSTDIHNSNEITTKNLTVTGSAYFFQLIIDKIKAVGGAYLITPADGFTIERVAPVPGSATELRLYWKATDGEKKIANMWQVNDQAICQTFNVATGVSYNVSNKYYWCLVTGVGTVTLSEQDYHYIDISTTVKDGTVNPEVGDEIAMLGYRGTDDADRQSAIYIAAYNSLDTGIEAPLFAQYEGINDFNLASHRTSVISSGYNSFKGDLITTAGDNVAGQISNITQNMSSINATVKSLTYDDKNLFDVTSFAGTELAEGNRWEFRSDALYSFRLWDDYMCVFENGLNENEWIMLANGTSTIYTPYLVLNNSNTYTLNMDFIKYDGDNAIKLYQYSNASNAKTLTSSQEWYLNASGQRVTTKPASRDYDHNEDVIQFTVPSNGIYRLGFQNIITNYSSGDDNYCDLNFVRLYVGAYDADQFLNWNDEWAESYSKLYMNSGKIELSVNDVSLIIDGLRNNIILNGNTIINGTLNLNDDTQGLVLTGQNGITKFSPESVGQSYRWLQQMIDKRDIDQDDYATLTAASGGGYVSTSTFEYVYRYCKATDEVTIGDLLISVTGNTPTSISTTYYVYENNVQKYTDTFTGTTLPESFEYGMTANAVYKIKFVTTCTYSTNAKATVNMKYEISGIIPILLQIGYDGIGMHYENNSAVYFGPTETIITYDDYGLKVDDTGVYTWLQDYNYAGWHKIQKELNVKTITSNYTLGYDDDFIIGNASSSITLTLPYDFPAGKRIYVKNLTSNTFTVSCSNRIILQDHTSTTSTFTTGNRTYFLLWSGTYWIVGYCG